MFHVLGFILQFTPSIIFHHPSLTSIPRKISKCNFSIHIHVYTVSVTYSPSFTISTPPPPPTGTSPSREDLFYLLAFLFCIIKEEKMTQGVFLWCFHGYMYDSLICFISSIPLLPTLVPFLWWF
jgi:hypothetical protein